MIPEEIRYDTGTLLLKGPVFRQTYPTDDRVEQRGSIVTPVSYVPEAHVPFSSCSLFIIASLMAEWRISERFHASAQNSEEIKRTLVAMETKIVHPLHSTASRAFA